MNMMVATEKQGKLNFNTVLQIQMCYIGFLLLLLSVQGFLHLLLMGGIAFLHLRLIWTSVCSDDVDNALMYYSCEGLA